MPKRPSQSDANTIFEASADRLLYAGAPLFQGGIGEAIAEIWRLKRLGSPQLVMTPNVDQSINIQRDSGFRSIYRKAAVRFVDGAPIVVLSRILGVSTTSRITGAALLPLVCDRAAQDGTRVLLLGGRPGVAARAARRLTTDHAGLVVESLEVPVFVDPSETQDVLAELAAASPDIVFIGLGSPKQERWFDHWRTELPGAVYIGSGAAADFAAGSMSRAPRLIQQLGLEWAYRFVQEPKRLFYRYMVKGPAFVSIAARSIIRALRKKYTR